MNIGKRLEQLINEGAEFYMPIFQGTDALDTAAIVGDGLLFYCFAGADPLRWEHFLKFDKVEDDGNYITFWLQGEVVATISEIEDPAQRAFFDEWKKEGKSPSAHVEHIQHLRKRNKYIEPNNKRPPIK
jgi:hypothetical protein